MKVMIVVTHLLGSGHLARALTLARAYSGAGDKVCVVSGGMPVPVLDRGDVPLFQLPPIRSNGAAFTHLLDDNGTAVSPDFLATRQDLMVAELHRFAPDILITELFPFGRRILRAEFRGLLEAVKTLANPPLVCASIRDILAPPSKPHKVPFANDMLTEFYDAVLVHSDPELTPLEISWPVSGALERMLNYTGFVSPPPSGPHPQACGKGEIIVSSGGGDLGLPLYEAAIDASGMLDHPFRLLIGGPNPQRRIDALHASRDTRSVTIEAARPDFRQMLYHAAASVSLCGYNTALDVLQAGTPTVFVPYDEGTEVEQGLRATALANRNGIAQLVRADLTPETLHAALAEVMAAPRRDTGAHGFDGAARTVSITHKLRKTR